jgi:hypothetical protein
MMVAHKYDEITGFCLNCGQQYQQAPPYCPATPNVTGVSHLMVKRRMAALDLIANTVRPRPHLYGITCGDSHGPTQPWRLPPGALGPLKPPFNYPNGFDSLMQAYRDALNRGPVKVIQAPRDTGKTLFWRIINSVRFNIGRRDS